ncbi:MAG: class I fructose-bisphosphate aldolase [Candidatus Paceibacterota bacterium]
MNKDILIQTIARLMMPPKGILAIDEGFPTCNKRFEELGVLPSEEKRREYRELLITTPNIEKYISGYILFDETIKQSIKDGKDFVLILQEKGIDVGIKVDQGLIDFSLNKKEKITKGLDDLKERLLEYKNMGATFAKWRAVYLIDENIPSVECMKENANILAKYAEVCQELNIVPIIEPEVLFNGKHNIEKCYEVTAKNLYIIFNELNKLNVFIPGIILKTSMVLSGKEGEEKANEEKVAEMTLKCLKENVPQNIGGIVFLSGGQSDIVATLNLNAMHNKGSLPWSLTFSYGRAIQNSALESWAKNPKDVVGAQIFLLERAKANSEASVGEYKR